MRIAALVLTTSALAAAQRPDQQAALPHIRTSAEATITTRPDQASIDIGVLSQAQTAQAAAAQNAKQVDAVLAALRKALGQSADIRTISYSVNPEYRYPREGGKPQITGYAASNIVQVKTTDLAAVGKVVDLAMQSGANTIHRLHFTLKDEQAARNQALKEAAEKARSEADAIAAALGVKIVRLLSADTGTQPPIRPLQDMPMAMRAEAAQAPPTPVEPGNIEVRARVTLTFEVGR
jgi:uncharacterized protein YggE